MKKFILSAALPILLLEITLVTFANDNTFQPIVVNSKIGDSLVTKDGNLTITCIGQKHGYGRKDFFDVDIFSPKSAIFHPDNSKFYINSLEGCKTVLYSTDSLKKIKIIEHDFVSGKGDLWLQPSGYYPFTHYPAGDKKRFKGKPVESALSKDGKYLFIPYYRRTFDLNAQDPSALAVIDTDKDEIILMSETGPLPKMVAVSNNNKLVAITHWGDNTVGFLDISDPDYKKWLHLKPVTIGNKLKLNYSLTEPVNRDQGSGFALRGTVFLPGDSLMLVCAMGGPTAVIDLKRMEWIGMIPALSLMRHIDIANDMVYLSNNLRGEVYSVPLDSIISGINTQKDKTRNFKIGGIKKAKVGGGARTLKISPDGKYIFVACNSASAMYILNAQTLEIEGQIRVDSYPVGLDVSPDGSLLIVTSQGWNNQGGNAVNIFKLDYKDKSAAKDTVNYGISMISALPVSPVEGHTNDLEREMARGNFFLFVLIPLMLIGFGVIFKIKINNARKRGQKYIKNIPRQYEFTSGLIS